MPIEFHCEHCGKLIRTSEEHGGKHGKCPSCHQRVYIPSPDVEILNLAPIDEASEKRARQAAQESNRLADALISETAETPGGAPRPAGGTARPASSGSGADRAGGKGAAPQPRPVEVPAISPAEVSDMVHEFAISMFEGELEEAQQIAEQLRRHPQLVNEAVQRIVSDELPPSAIEHIPRPVLMGFLKQLRTGG